MAEEPIIEMASGKPTPPPAPTPAPLDPFGGVMPMFSGMAIPSAPSAAPATVTAGFPQTKRMHPRDLKKLDKLLHDEEQAVKAAKEAARRRDFFCLDIEKEYGLIGFTWNVNFKTKQIEIIGKREPQLGPVPERPTGSTGIQG